MRYLFLGVLLSGLVALSGCHKASAPALGEHFGFCSDSCHAEAPNVITPNGDGYNDLFFVSHNWIDAIHVEVKNAAQSVVFSTDLLHGTWDGHDPGSAVPGPTAGRYTYHISVYGTNGVHLTGDHVLWVVPQNSSPCFSDVVQPVFGDQFDPRVCGVVYASNDVICIAP